MAESTEYSAPTATIKTGRLKISWGARTVHYRWSK